MYDIVYFVEKMVAELHLLLNSSRPVFLVRIYSSADKVTRISNYLKYMEGYHYNSNLYSNALFFLP
jgi:hypothetical protein